VSAPAEPPLELVRVSAGYGPIQVLDRLSLRLGDREVVALLGANGSGKSTALKTVMGLTRVTGGRIALEGREITGWPAHACAAAGLGYVPQTGNVFADLSVEDNLRMGAFLRPKELARASQAVYALFPRLAERRRALAGSLSGGERRMLAIGMTLLLEPRVLLLDEPSSDLAPSMVDDVFAAIEGIHAERGIPILLVEQNVARALAIAGRVCVLVRGREAFDRPAVEVEPALLRQLFLEGGQATEPRAAGDRP